MVKSLAESQLVYLLAPLHSNHHAIKEINDMFYHSLWNGKGNKIKRKVMINEPGNGVVIPSCLYSNKLTFLSLMLIPNEPLLKRVRHEK